MFNSFTVITTADPDEALLADFTAGLIEQANCMECRVTLIIVDAMAGYTDKPDFLGILSQSNPCFSVRWRAYKKATNKSMAIEAALEWADEAPVIFMDSDMIVNLHDIPRFLLAHAKGAEMVFAWRVSRKGVAWWRKILTVLFGFFVRALLRLPVHDVNAPMVSLSANALNLFASIRHQLDPRISSRLFGFRALEGRVAEVRISTAEIIGRSSTFSYADLFKVGILWFKDIALYWRHEKKLFTRNLGRDS